MNVEQFASAYDAVQAGSTDPDVVRRAGHWQQIKDYVQSAAIWLARPGTQRCLRTRGLWLVASHLDVRMALRHWKLDRAERLEYLLDVGDKAKDAFHRVAPQCQRIELVVDLLDRFVLYERLRPWPIPLPDPPPLRFAQLVDPALVETVALGGALVAGRRSGRRRRERHDEPLQTSREEVARAVHGLADDETQVLVSALRRGKTWTGAQDQVQRVRSAVVALDEDAHRCAVELYCEASCSPGTSAPASRRR